MTCAPVALFVYNRPEHTYKTVCALQANLLAEQTPLYIFSDAAKNNESKPAVAEVRAYIRGITGFHSLTIVERPENYGLSKSIIDGVTKICDDYNCVIVLEDDLVTAPFFLQYMNESLEIYSDEQDVVSIHGYQLPIKQKLPETFFLKGADCWGWATWKRAWELFNPDGQYLYDELIKQNLCHAFDLDDSYPYTKMLAQQIAGKNNSWAIRWHASAFLKNKYTLHPGRSLVCNIGIDGSGTHCSNTEFFITEMSKTPIQIEKINVEESIIARHSIVNFHQKSQPSLLMRMFKKLSRLGCSK